MALVARGGAAWLLAPPVLAVAVLLLLPWLGPVGVPLASALGLLFVLFLVFFRDPDRPPGPAIVSAADGKVLRIDAVEDPDLGPCERLCVFMRPMDVHVNRVPLDGTVLAVRRFPGAHVPAFSKDSDRNERAETLLRTAHGDVKVVQIAGAVARRTVPYLEPGQTVAKGDRLGLIRLSSRCDILAPPGVLRWTVGVGDRVFAGVSPVAEPMPRGRGSRTVAPLAVARGKATTAPRGAKAAKAPRQGSDKAGRQAAPRKAPRSGAPRQAPRADAQRTTPKAARTRAASKATGTRAKTARAAPGKAARRTVRGPRGGSR